MENRIRIARQLVALAKELVGTRLNEQVVRTNVADVQGIWKDFRGMVDWRGIHAKVNAVRMTLAGEESNYKIKWYGGVWLEGNADNVLWKGGRWINGTFNGGVWMSGTWKGGVWKGGYDVNKKWHAEGDSPDKWGGGDRSLDPSNDHWMICRVMDNGTEKTVNTFKMRGDAPESMKNSTFKKRLENVGFSIPDNADIFDGDNGSLVVRDFDGKTLFIMKKNPNK